MRLWRFGRSKSLAHHRYAAIDEIDRQRLLHLFRALLRQCTYLPDPAARKYLHSHVVSRFRDYHPKNAVSETKRDGKHMQLIQQRRPVLIKTARKGLLYLRRANDGHPLHLGKILSMTYGRVGKRRHLLLKSLKIPDIPIDEAAVKRLSDPREQGVPHPSQQLMALIWSQSHRKLSLFSKSSHPTRVPDIPEKNSWGRPMPVRRVRNMKRRWYAEALNRIMPPLPEEDWNKLRKLASGETPWEGPVPRRGPDSTAGFKHDLMRYPGLVSSPHDLTPRYMKRLWAKIFAQCPLMRPNASRRGGWEILWGETRDAKRLALPLKSNGSMSPMFQGVDEQGKIPRKRKEGLEWSNQVAAQWPGLAGYSPEASA